MEGCSISLRGACLTAAMLEGPWPGVSACGVPQPNTSWRDWGDSPGLAHPHGFTSVGIRGRDGIIAGLKAGIPGTRDR